MAKLWYKMTDLFTRWQKIVILVAGDGLILSVNRSIISGLNRNSMLIHRDSPLMLLTNLIFLLFNAKAILFFLFFLLKMEKFHFVQSAA